MKRCSVYSLDLKGVTTDDEQKYAAGGDDIEDNKHAVLAVDECWENERWGLLKWQGWVFFFFCLIILFRIILLLYF